MTIARIQGENFRQFERFALAPAVGLNLITGANAAGKTTVLEAIYGCGRARSFRGATADEISGAAGAAWQLQAQANNPHGPSDDLRIAWTGAAITLSANRNPLMRADLAQRLPVQILEPGTHRLLEEGPGYRRRYLDWGVFHVEPRFYPTWRRYQRGLTQRNRALKAKAEPSEIASWDAELAECGETLNRQRLQHLDPLRRRLDPLVQRLLGQPGGTLELHCGWSPEHSLREALAQSLDRDRRYGQTQAGPHRAELRLKLGGQGVKHRVSRGQQKLLVAALLLAQSALIHEATGRAPVLLVDDFPAELGAPFQARLLEALRESGSQVFLSAIERGNMLLNPEQDALFHVEQGRVEPVRLL